MPKKTKISNGDLTALFSERIRETPHCPVGMSVAIVPDKRSGWTAMMNKVQRNRYPECAKRVEAIQKQLRAIHDLAED
jgi:hypothetical protein